MGYRRETLVLRAPGGASMGFVIWERDARQGTLRCQIKNLGPQQEYRLLWMPEGEFSLRDGGVLRADNGGANNQTIMLAGDIPLIGVVLAKVDGSLSAQAFLQGKESTGPERLQALVYDQLAPRPVRAVKQEKAEPEREKHSVAKPTAQKDPVEPAPSTKQTHAEAHAPAKRSVPPPSEPQQKNLGIPRGWERQWNEAQARYDTVAWWQAPAWPPPPGLPGATWAHDRWVLRLGSE